MATVRRRRTVNGILETASLSSGLRIKEEEGFQGILGHRPEVASRENCEFVRSDNILGSGMDVAGHIAAVVTLEGLQAHPTKG